jgi:hypothetical protein
MADPQPRRSTRSIPDKVRAPNAQALRNGYAAFNATEVIPQAGGGNDTDVTLSVNGTDYPGSSGTGVHAEMVALAAALAAVGSVTALKEIAGKTVDCTDKPVCYRCSIILGLLEFAPQTEHTQKTKSGMGQTQWVLNEALRDALFAEYGKLDDVLNNASNVDKL